MGKTNKKHWADGTTMISAYYVTGTDSEFDGDLSYDIYDGLSHNEMSIDDAIKEICNGSPSDYGEGEIETLPRDVHIMGYSSDNRYFVTCERYTGILDVWRKAN